MVFYTGPVNYFEAQTFHCSNIRYITKIFSQKIENLLKVIFTSASHLKRVVYTLFLVFLIKSRAYSHARLFTFQCILFTCFYV